MTGEELREIRKSKKLTQAQMGEKMGVTVQTIRNLESGRHAISKSVAVHATMFGML